jgi:hypothetical protein
MSRTIMLVGLLAAAAALAPRATYAQRVDGVRAMLARSDAVFPVAAAASSRAQEDRIDGERALLGRTEILREPAVAFTAAKSAPIDGVYALLCRRP